MIINFYNRGGGAYRLIYIRHIIKKKKETLIYFFFSTCHICRWIEFSIGWDNRLSYSTEKDKHLFFSEYNQSRVCLSTKMDVKGLKFQSNNLAKTKIETMI